MSESNSAFISYRRDVSAYIALAVFQDLHANGINVFYDIENIKAGQFPTIIANQIAARPYFILILTPGTLDRCPNQDDWVRREIEYAVELKRLIVPLYTPEFNLSDFDKFLASDVAGILKTFNMIEVPHRYFKYAMQEVRSFLVPTKLETSVTPVEDHSEVEAQVQQAMAEPAVTESQLTAQEYFEHAQASETLDDRIANYTEAIRLNPKFAGAYNNRAMAYSEKGEFDKAIADFTETFRLKPSQLAFTNRIVAYISKGDYNKAIEDSTKAIRFDPRDAIAFNNRGWCYYLTQRYDEAIKDCSEAIRLNPEFAEAYDSLAHAYARKREYRKAVDYGTKAIAMKPPWADELKEDIEKWRELI